VYQACDKGAMPLVRRLPSLAIMTISARAIRCVPEVRDFTDAAGLALGHDRADPDCRAIAPDWRQRLERDESLG
jgi:hypothetical protein